MKLPRHLSTLILLALATTTLSAQPQDQPPATITNPADLDFHAHLVTGPNAFHTGEPIKIEISYSSDLEKKYQISRINPNPNFGGVAPHLSSTEGVTDLPALLQDPEGGFAGSFLGGGPEFLQTKPITQDLDLSAWYRFQKPGHYSIEVSSNSVWRMRPVEEGGGRENIELKSNAVEFEILPHSDEWDAAELAEIEQTLATVKYPGERLAPIQRMAYLDTPAAISKAVTLFLKTSNDSEGWLIYSGLRESSHTDLVVPLLLAALPDATVSVPPLLPQLLAELQTRKELGLQGPVPTDPAQRAAWNQKLKERYKVRDGYLARDNTQLLISIQLRTGPQRATAIYQAWTDAERLNASTPQPSNSLSQLRQEALNVQRELAPYQRLQLVTSSLQTVPHEQLLPIIRDLTNGSGPEAWSLVHSAFELWCKDQLAECSAEIFKRASKFDPVISQHTIFLMPESEHPELDKMLQQKLTDPKIIWQAASGVNFSSFVLRAGSKNLLSSVDAALNQYAKDRKFECEPQAYFLGYLFRFAPKDATARLTAIMQAPSDPCGNQMLRYLELGRYSDDLIPIAIAALNSPNLNAVGASAFLIATHAPESAKALLWQRLDALRRDWRDRAAEVQSASFTWGNSAPDLASRLEQSLASALANATNWKLSDSEHDRLRDGCLTDQCRNIADGKMRIGM
jgi:hypothetical protein